MSDGMTGSTDLCAATTVSKWAFVVNDERKSKGLEPLDLDGSELDELAYMIRHVVNAGLRLGAERGRRIDVGDSSGLSDHALGQRVLDVFLAGREPVCCECTTCGAKGAFLFRWDGNAQEQLGAMIRGGVDHAESD